MSSETVENVVDTTTTGAVNGESAQPVADQAEAKDARQRRQRTPPEELFDLTKPIPRADKPNKAAHDEEVEAINTAIDALKEKKNEVQKKIDSALNGGRNTAAGKEREALKALRSKKGALIDEKKKMRARLDLAKKAADSLMNDRKAARANIRFNDVASIDSEIKKLKTRQETTSMSLSEEKKLIKEIDALQNSKGLLTELKDKDASIDNAKEQRKVISMDMAAKDKEIDDVQDEITEKQKIVDQMKDSEAEARKNLTALKTERDAIKKEIGEKIGERNKCRDAFREANDKYYDVQRAVKAQKKMKYEEEKKKREEEWAAKQAAIAAEEAKKIPYEEEMVLCDYLANYLTKTYLTSDEKTSNESKKSDVIAVKDDPFAGFAPLKKNDEETYFKKGKGKKPRVRASKKNAAPVFKLNVDSFEQFGLLGLTPPTSLDTVQKSVDELKAKKQWYSEQERGSVPTATEIRKANVKAAQKLRQGSSSSAPKSNGKLDISSDDFAPLSAGASTTAMNATWGQKPAEEETEAPAAPEGEVVEASA